MDISSSKSLLRSIKRKYDIQSKSKEGIDSADSITSSLNIIEKFHLTRCRFNLPESISAADLCNSLQTIMCSGPENSLSVTIFK